MTIVERREIEDFTADDVSDEMLEMMASSGEPGAAAMPTYAAAAGIPC